MRLKPVTFCLLALASLLPASGFALTSVEELQDVKPDHWATPAISNLVDKKIVEGQPNQTFQGKKATTRNEMAVVLNALLNAVERDLSQVSTDKSDKREVQVLSNLQQQLSGYISTLGNDVKTLQDNITENKAKNTDQDKRLGLLEKTQIHGDVSMGVLSDFGNGRNSRSTDGIKDATTALGRLRLTIDAPVVEDGGEGSKIGSGVIHARLVAAFGRYASIGSRDGSLTDYPFNLYSRVSTDVSAFNEGYGSGSVGNLYKQNGNTSILRPNIYLESAFYSQHLKPGIPLLTNLGLNHKGDKWKASSDIFAGVVRWWDLFDVSPYRGNELQQFQNNAFINIPGIAVNVAQPMVGYQWHQGLGNWASADVSTAVGSIDAGNLMDGLNVTYEGKVNYNTGFLGERWAKPGSFYAGAYHMFEASNRRFTDVISTLTNRTGVDIYPGLSNKRPGNAFYAGWNQEWWKGIGSNVGFLVNNSAPIIVSATTFQPGPARVAGAAKTAFTSALQIPVSIICKARPKDTIGLGYAFVDLQEGGLPRGQDAYEQVMEAYYRYQINDSFSIVPSAQLIFNRLGLKANSPDVIFGVRMNHTF